MLGVRRIASLVAASAIAGTLTLVVPAGPSAAATGCNSAFSDPGAVTFEETLALPRIQTGLADGVYTVEELADVFGAVDDNQDGTICLKSQSNLRGNSTKNNGAFYVAKDNDHPQKES
jgi:hypothetical protein